MRNATLVLPLKTHKPTRRHYFLRVNFRPFSFFTRTTRAKINPAPKSHWLRVWERITFKLCLSTQRTRVAVRSRCNLLYTSVHASHTSIDTGAALHSAGRSDFIVLFQFDGHSANGRFLLLY